MKRWKIVLPTLLATGGLPLVSLVGCNNTEKVHVYFNNGGFGTLTGDLDIEIKKGTRWCDLVEGKKVPEATGIDGYTFAGWFRQGAIGPLADNDPTTIDSNWSVTARFNAPATPKVVGGSTTLVDQVGSYGGHDEKLWSLKLGQETLSPVSWSVVGEESEHPGITINSSGQVSWGERVTQRTWAFKVRATYEGNSYDSDPIYLSVGPVTTTFQDDDWDVVCWWANAGLDALHSVYESDCKKNNFVNGTLIGYEKTIELNDCDHKVMVIDENADAYDKNGVETPAALTFQFQNLISGTTAQGSGNCLYIDWESDIATGSSNYWESNLENALNSTTLSEPVKWHDTNEQTVDENQQISVYQMINASESDLAENIKLVNRSIYTYDYLVADMPVWELTTNQTRLFCPTISNYFSPIGIAKTSEGIISPQTKVLCLSEGQPSVEIKQYAYYADNDKIGDSPIDHVLYDFLVLWDYNHTQNDKGESWFYWTGSPYLDFNDQIADVSGNGCMCNYGIVTDHNAVAPCFCI